MSCIKFEKYCRLREAQEKASELKSDEIIVKFNETKEISNGFQNPTKYINEYHYNFWSHKKFNIPTHLVIRKWAFIFMSICSIIFSLYSLNVFSKDAYLWRYGLGVIIFFVFAFIAAYNILYIQSIVNEQIINMYSKNPKDKDFGIKVSSMKGCDKFNHIIKMKSKSHVKKVQKDWIANNFNEINKIEFAKFVSFWQKLKRDNSIEDKKIIRDFFHNSSNNYHTYIIALFSLCGVIIVATGDATIFYELFTMAGLKYYLLLFLLGFEISIIVSITSLMADGIINNYDDFINDILKSDDSPSDLRVKRFVNVLLNYDQ